MAYFAKLTLAEFRELAEHKLNSSFDGDDYQKLIAEVARDARRLALSLEGAKSKENPWAVWTSSVTDFGSLPETLKTKVPKFNENTIRDLSRCNASPIHAFAFHYRAHRFHGTSDLEFADRIDTAIFGAPLRKLGIKVFDYEPEEYVFPKPSAPFRYPPYLTRKSVEECLERDLTDAVWLSPHNHWTIPLEGRSEEWRTLTAFMDMPGSFKTLPVIGPSGSGKTRLVSQWMKQYVPLNGHDTGWDAGILTTMAAGSIQTHARDPRPWKNWAITKNTLIVIDYTHAFDDVARAIFEKATNQEVYPPKKVRLLILDHVMPRLIQEDFLWRGFAGDVSFAMDQFRSSYLCDKIVLRAERDQSKLLEHVIVAAANVGKAESDRYKIDSPVILHAAKHLDDLGTETSQGDSVRHPLFAALLGQIIRESAEQEIDFSRLSRRELITHYFSNPDRLPWSGWELDGDDEGNRERNLKGRETGLLLGALVSAATLRRGLPVVDAVRQVPALLDAKGDTLQRAGRIVSADDPDTIQPFLPDILGETFVLKFLIEIQHRPEHVQDFIALLGEARIEGAAEIAQNFRETIARTARNLSHDDPGRRDVVVAWEALAKTLDPGRVEDNTPLHLAISYAIIDVLEHVGKQVDCLRELSELNREDPSARSTNLHRLLKTLDEMKSKVSLQVIVRAAETDDVFQATDMFLRFIEHSSRGDEAIITATPRMAASFWSGQTQGETILMFAALLGRPRSVETILAHAGELATAMTDDGWTAVMFACREGHLSVVEFLHAQDPELIAAIANNGETALIVASRYGHLPVIEFLHAQNPNLIAARTTSGQNALIAASWFGHLAVVKFPHAQNPDLITARMTSGENALIAASRYGHFPLVDFLHTQNPDLLAETADDGQTALMTASKNGHLPVVEFLQAQNPELIAAIANNGETALIAASRYGHLPVVKFLHAQNPDLITAKTASGQNALIAASCFGHLPVVEFVHAQNPKLIAVRVNDGWTALMAASYFSHLPVVEFLCAQNPDLLGETADDGWTALMAASEKGHLPVVEFLHGQKPGLIAAVSDGGWTALIAASQHGHLPVVEFLHAQDPDLITAALDGGWNALMGASENGHLPVVEFLHAQNPGLVTATTEKGWTALIAASLHGRLSVVEYLLAQSPNLIAAVADGGWTPLIAASRNGHLPVVKFLHAQDPDLIAASTDDGDTALIAAVRYGHLPVVKFLHAQKPSLIAATVIWFDRLRGYLRLIAKLLKRTTKK